MNEPSTDPQAALARALDELTDSSGSVSSLASSGEAAAGLELMLAGGYAVGFEPDTAASPLLTPGRPPTMQALDPEERRARRRAQVASSSRRQRSRRKQEAQELQFEAVFLEKQLELLRSTHKITRASATAAEWEERAIAQRIKRRHAESTNVALKTSIYQFHRYIRDLRTVFSSSPMSNAKPNLHDLLHSPTHLAKDPTARFRDYQAVCTNERLDLAMQILTRETAGIGFDTPQNSTHTIHPGGNRFGMTTVAVFAFETPDMDRIFTTACTAILDGVSEWPHHRLANTYGSVVDASGESIRYGIADTRYQNQASGQEIAMELRLLSYTRLTDSYGMLLFDYVDEDELYPIKEGTSMRRDDVGGMLVRREMCEDGVERVVGRVVVSKIFSSQDPTLIPAVQYFSQFVVLAADMCCARVYKAIQSGAMDGCHISV